MEIICNQNELNNAIQLVNKAVASRPTHPILANILLTADQGTNKISVTGFDLNLGIQTSFDGTVKNSGAITIPSKLLSEIVNKLPNETPVSLKVEENLDNILIKSDRGSFNLKGIPSDEYPNLPFVESGTSLNIDPSSFLKALKSTIFASSNDDSKQLLTGVNFTFKPIFILIIRTFPILPFSLGSYFIASSEINKKLIIIYSLIGAYFYYISLFLIIQSA